MKILVTGAMGSIGMATTRAFLAQGHDVRCFDLKNRFNTKRSRLVADQVELHWGDVRNPADVAAAVADREVVVHLAAILFPDSEADSSRSRAVNVDGTRNVVEAMKASPNKPTILFPSSIAVYGVGRYVGPPRQVDDPTSPDSEYAGHKVECEDMIRASGIPWTILRVGAAIEPGASAKITPLAVRTMFDVTLDTRIEWVHPEDVGLAFANTAALPELRSKVLMIAGGPSCRATQRDFFTTAFEAVGIGMLPETAFGDGGFEMDWMDCDESQKHLDFQRHSWEDFHAAFQDRMRLHRWALRPLRPLVRRVLLHFSHAHRGRGQALPSRRSISAVSESG
jgi:nucleoside-diphosphate-sugar epimerase